eukprot:1599202-Pleurochrysis_carterae.AAC.1
MKELYPELQRRLVAVLHPNMARNPCHINNHGLHIRGNRRITSNVAADLKHPFESRGIFHISLHQLNCCKSLPMTHLRDYHSFSV